MKYKINYKKNIGDIIFIVEGSKTEFFILKKIFNQIFNYTVETIKRSTNFKYHKFCGSIIKNNRIFVINSFESNIKFINQDDEFLNNLFETLIDDYNFPVDNSSIFYLFDRDVESNIDKKIILNLLSILKNSQDNDEVRQGLLLLNYPSIEAFILENFSNNYSDVQFKTGKELKRYNSTNHYNQNEINEYSLLQSAENEILSIEHFINNTFNIDDFGNINLDIFKYMESCFSKHNTYRILSLLVISLIDLGLIEEV